MENLIIQPWYWRLFPLENKTGSDIFASLFLSDHTICTLLESPNIISSDNKHLARYSICAGQPRKIKGQLQMWTPSIGHILPFLKQLLQREKLQNNDFNSEEIAKLPFTGGWLGWLGYDLAYEIERLP
ncbi:MAG TPA: anthranilate synthase component I, partial [Allocoleopsis sp.]